MKLGSHQEAFLRCLIAGARWRMMVIMININHHHHRHHYQMAGAGWKWARGPLLFAFPPRGGVLTRSRGEGQPHYQLSTKTMQCKIYNL